MIELPPQHLEEVRQILRRHVAGYEVRVFGSRVGGNPKPYSDLDLVIVGHEKIPPEILWALQEDLEESDLPFRVDLLDWNTISPEFQATIGKKFEILDFKQDQ